MNCTIGRVPRPRSLPLAALPPGERMAAGSHQPGPEPHLHPAAMWSCHWAPANPETTPARLAPCPRAHSSCIRHRWALPQFVLSSPCTHFTVSMGFQVLQSSSYHYRLRQLGCRDRRPVTPLGMGLVVCDCAIILIIISKANWEGISLHCILTLQGRALGLGAGWHGEEPLVPVLQSATWDVSSLGFLKNKTKKQ